MTTSLQEYVSLQADRRGDQCAIVMGEERVSYGVLDAVSNQLAHVLVDAGAHPGDRVCLMADKSPTALIAMLGVLKSGCMYVPIDLASPAARIARIVGAADPSIALAVSTASPLLEELTDEGALGERVRIGALDRQIRAHPACSFGPSEVAAAPASSAPATRREVDGAHILFTSGSTGEPKGVVVTHRGVRAFVDWAVRHFGIAPGDRLSGHPPLHFDLSTFDIFGAFAAGAELHLVPPSLLLPRQLAAYVQEAQLTQWFSVPSAMAYMSRHNAIPIDGFPSLQRVLWCGEVLPAPVLIDWMRRNPQARFTNLYGPTETTIASSYYVLPETPNAQDPIPIGTPCPGEEIIVFAENHREAAPEETGELYIGGVGLSLGYWRDEPKTRKAFVTDPRPGHQHQQLYRTGDLGRRDRDGLLYFAGRRDSQIKSRGYRIELGEVEAAVSAVEEISECAVVAVGSDGFEGTLICCAFATVGDGKLTPQSLRSALRTKLPAYMVPVRWRAMPALPKNVNGKIDRRELKERFAAQAQPLVTEEQRLGG